MNRSHHGALTLPQLLARIAVAAALAPAIRGTEATAAASGPPPLRSPELVQVLRSADLDDELIRAALAEHEAYLAKAMEVQRTRIEALKGMALDGLAPGSEERTRKAQEIARAMRSAMAEVDAAERGLVERVIARIPENPPSLRVRAETALAAHLARRSAMAWARDRMVRQPPLACAADPRRALGRLKVSAEERAQCAARIDQYESTALPAVRRWRDALPEAAVLREQLRGAQLDPIARGLARSAPVAAPAGEVGSALRSLLADLKGLLPPSAYEELRMQVLRDAYPAVLQAGGRIDGMMRRALKLAQDGKPDEQAAARNMQKYRDWCTSRDARCAALMQAADRGVPMGAVTTRSMMGESAPQIADEDGAIARAVEEMRAMRALMDAAAAAGLDGVEADAMDGGFMFELGDSGLVPAAPDAPDAAGESPIASAVSVAVTRAITSATTQPGDGSGTVEATSVSTQTTVTGSSAEMVGSMQVITLTGSGAGGTFTISGGGPAFEIEVQADESIDLMPVIGEGGFAFGDTGLEDGLMPLHEQNIDDSRFPRGMSAPAAEAATLAQVLDALKPTALGEPGALAARDAVEAYRDAHKVTLGDLAQMWSGEPGGQAPEPAPAADPKEAIAQAMARAEESMRRFSDPAFIDSRYQSWARAPESLKSLEAAMLDGVAKACEIGAPGTAAAQVRAAVDSLKLRRMLEVERGLHAASGRNPEFDADAHLGQLDLVTLVASTPLSSSDRASAAAALAGYEAQLTEILAQRRVAVVEAERLSQVAGAQVLRSIDAGVGQAADAAPPADSADAQMQRLEGAKSAARTACTRVSDFQRSASDKALAAVSPQGRARLDAALTRARHPSVARDASSADPQIALAMSLVEQDDAMLQRVIAVASEYQAAYDALFDRMVKADAERQAASAEAPDLGSGQSDAKAVAARARKSAALRELTRLRTERSELNDRTRRALRAALGPRLGVEIADLPPRRGLTRG